MVLTTTTVKLAFGQIGNRLRLSESWIWHFLQRFFKMVSPGRVVQMVKVILSQTFVSFIERPTQPTQICIETCVLLSVMGQLGFSKWKEQPIAVTFSSSFHQCYVMAMLYITLTAYGFTLGTLENMLFSCHFHSLFSTTSAFKSTCWRHLVCLKFVLWMIEHECKVVEPPAFDPKTK